MADSSGAPKPRPPRRRIAQHDSEEEDMEVAQTQPRRQRRRIVQDDSEEDTEVVQPLATGKPKKNLKRKHSDRSSDVETYTDGLFKAPRPDDGTYWNRNLTNLQKLEKSLLNVNIDRRSIDRVGDYMKSNMEEWFLASAQPKTFTAARTQKGVVKMTNKSKVDRASYQMELNGPHGARVLLNFNQHDKEIIDLTDRDIKVQLAGYLENFYSHFAQNWSIPSNTQLHAEIADAALAIVEPRTQRLDCPTWIETKGFQVTIAFIDEASGEREFFDYSTCMAMDLAPGFKGVPVDVIQYHRGKTGTKEFPVQMADGSYKTVVPKDILDGTAKQKPKFMADDLSDPRKLLNTEEFMKLCSWKMTGRRSTQEKMRAYRNHLLRIYSRNQEGGKGRWFSLTGLFKIKRELSKSTSIDAGASMLRDLMGGLSQATRLSVSLISVDVQWITFVLEFASKVYADTGSLLETLLSVAGLVDKCNVQIRNGYRPPNACSCSEEMKSVTVHKCAMHLGDVLCHERKRNRDGLEVCPDCYDNDQDSDNRSEIRAANTLRAGISKEAKTIGQDFNDIANQKIFQDGLADVKTHLNTGDAGKYTDYMTGIQYDAYLGFHPFNQVIDGVLPLALDHRGELRNHVKGNVRPMAACANMGKGPSRRNLPADMVAIAAHVKAFMDTPAGQFTGDAKKRSRLIVLEKCDEHNEVQAKHNLNSNAVLGKKMSTKEYAAMKDEFVSGRLNNVDTEANNAARRHARRMLKRADILPCGWEDDERGTILQFAHDAGVTEYAGDGAPWPFPDVDMTAEFRNNGWNMLFSYFHVRLVRMDLECNRHWKTVDDELRLLGEMFQQLFLEDNELLRLPVSPFMGNALMVSIGHEQHGAQMRTGFSENPKSLADRDPNLSNILAETWFSNSFKQDYAADYYEGMVSYMWKLNIPPEFFNEAVTATRSSLEPAKLLNLDELDYSMPTTTRELDDALEEDFNAKDGGVAMELPEAD